MNVLVTNKQQDILNDLDIDIIKSITGSYEVLELVEMFKSFFYGKMILDVTALKEYDNLKTYENLTKDLDPEKIIFLLPEGSNLCTPNFLGNLIDLGIYNFTTNLNGIKYLLKKTNTKDDVKHIKKMSINTKDTDLEKENIGLQTSKIKILGVKNVTEHAGSTTFIYLLKKELVHIFGQDKVIALEINKNDFSLFRDKNMYSIKENEIDEYLKKYSDVSIILIDLNLCSDTSFCEDIIYLVEPSTIKLNKLLINRKDALLKLIDDKVVLNKSLLLNTDVVDFEKEAGIKVFYNMPPLDERKRNATVNDFLIKLGLITNDIKDKDNGLKIFGLFRK